jgi:hypothetical protein
MKVAADDLAWVTAVRNARVAAVERVQRGDENFGDVLRELRNDPLACFTYLVALTDVHRCLGKVAGRRLIASLSLEPLIRVANISDENIVALSKCCGMQVS